MSLTGATATLLPLWYGYSLGKYGYTKYGPVAGQFWSRPWYLLSLVALLIFLIFVFVRIRQAHKSVTLFKSGLQFSFVQPRYLRWENISGIAVEIRGKSPFRYRAWIFPGTGKPIHLPATTQDLPHLLTQIKAHLYPRLLPELQASFDAGKWLYFGPVSIQSTSIRIPVGAFRKPGPAVPWSQVRSISVASGRLVVEFKQGPLLKLPVSMIPNVEILLQIIQSGVAR